MFEREIVKLIPQLNFKKLNFILALVFMEVATDKEINYLLARFEECPRIISLYKTFGEYNLIALVYAENQRVLDSIMGSCMLRIAREVRRSIVVPIQGILIGEYIPIKIPVKKYDDPPCGIKCSECTRYNFGECVGCPVIRKYRGRLAITMSVNQFST